MTDPIIPGKILAAATEAVTAARPNTHGDAVINHGAIAILWNAYITAKTYSAGGNVDTMKLLGAADAAQMMVLFKMARTISGNPQHADHYVDQAGYSALAARMWGADPAPDPVDLDEDGQQESLAGLDDDPPIYVSDYVKENATVAADGSIRVPIQRQRVPGIEDDDGA